jgi:hypothetical protein
LNKTIKNLEKIYTKLSIYNFSEENKLNFNFDLDYYKNNITENTNKNKTKYKKKNKNKNKTKTKTKRNPIFNLNSNDSDSDNHNDNDSSISDSYNSSISDNIEIFKIFNEDFLISMKNIIDNFNETNSYLKNMMTLFSLYFEEFFNFTNCTDLLMKILWVIFSIAKKKLYSYETNYKSEKLKNFIDLLFKKLNDFFKLEKITRFNSSYYNINFQKHIQISGTKKFVLENAIMCPTEYLKKELNTLENKEKKREIIFLDEIFDQFFGINYAYNYSINTNYTNNYIDNNNNSNNNRIKTENFNGSLNSFFNMNMNNNCNITNINSNANSNTYSNTNSNTNSKTYSNSNSNKNIYFLVN